MSTTPDDFARTQVVPNLGLNETRLLGLDELPGVSADEPPPSVLRDCTLGPKLGEGAMGAVYRAGRGRTGQAVAVEVLPRRLTVVPGFLLASSRVGRAFRSQARGDGNRRGELVQVFAFLTFVHIVRTLLVSPHREGSP